MLTPIARQTATDSVFDQVAGEIVSGELGPGDILPSERALATALGVSRPALREALGRLAQAGLVQIRQGGSTQVTNWNDVAGLDLLPRLLLVNGEVDVVVVRSIFEMREVIGTDAARLCARRADTATRERISNEAGAMSISDDPAELAPIALRFWRQVINGSGNIAYRMAHNSLAVTYEPMMDIVAELLRRELTDVRAHQELAAAIAAADEPRARELARHVLRLSEPDWKSALIMIGAQDDD
ncbi:MAG: FadR family transcriptional regulator [Actinobacteria bacterium]|nr:FadR family transcriptional regulator [Actinomycetota bacterium]